MQQKRCGTATNALQQLSNGQESAVNQLFPLVYDELRAVAGNYLKEERPGHTLEATALIHEVFIRLSKQKDLQIDGRDHFFVIASEAMRRILVERARRRDTLKRGKDFARLTLSLAIVGDPNTEIDILALDQAIDKLAIEEEPYALDFLAGVGEHEYLARNRLAVERHRARPVR